MTLWKQKNTDYRNEYADSEEDPYIPPPPNSYQPSNAVEQSIIHHYRLQEPIVRSNQNLLPRQIITHTMAAITAHRNTAGHKRCNLLFIQLSNLSFLLSSPFIIRKPATKKKQGIAMNAKSHQPHIHILLDRNEMRVGNQNSCNKFQKVKAINLFFVLYSYYFFF